MNYLVVSLLCSIALLIAITMVKENELISISQKRQFIIIAILIAFEVVLDTLALYINGLSEKYNLIFKFIKIAEFIVAPVIPTLLSHLMCRRSVWGKIKKYFIITITFNTITQLITFFYPLMFVISENGVYSRTVFSYSYIIILLFNYGLLLVSSVKTFVQNYHKLNSLLFITVLLLIGLTVRALDNSSNADWLAITFCYFLFLEYFTNSYCKIDTMTTLLNQKAFITRKAQINYSTVFIAIDVNNFKYINDNYGHLKGDEYLRMIGEAIFSVYSKYGFCFRSGGDEFTVILKPGMFYSIKKEGNCNMYKQINKMMRMLDKEIEMQAKREPLIKNGVSQGFGIYKIIEDCSNIREYKTIDEVLAYADDRMYRAKASKKKAEI